MIPKMIQGEPVMCDDDEIKRLKIALATAIKERDEAQTKCVRLFHHITNLLEKIYVHNESLYEVQQIPSGGQVFDNCKQGDAQAKKPMQGLYSRDNEGKGERSRVLPETSGIMAQKACQGTREIHGVSEDVSAKPSRENLGGLSQEGSRKSTMQNRSEERGCGGEDSKTECVSGVRGNNADSRPSPRLQQAVRRAVALRYMSREEAQDLLNCLSSDCGKGLVRVSELESLVDFARDVLLSGHEDLRESAKTELTRLEQLAKDAQ